MKKISILISLGLILTFNLEAKKIEGKVFFENDTIDVIFKIPFKIFTQEPNYEKLQYRVSYFDSRGKKNILRPDDAKEIQFIFMNDKVRMLSRNNSIGLGGIISRNTIFLRLETDGKLKLFNYYFTKRYRDMNAPSPGAMTGGSPDIHNLSNGEISGQSPAMHNPSANPLTGEYTEYIDRYILQKGDGELKRPKALTFKKNMAEYISECPALVEKIESKEFRINDLELIVRFYNSDCR